MKKTASPNPSWSIGSKIKSPVDQMVDYDLKKMNQPEVYKLLIGSVVPRPIAFVSTCNTKGQGNLAPFSFFNVVSSDPPCIMVSITRKNDGSKKDTLLNIEATGEFVVNTVAEWMVEPMNQCSGSYPHGVNEMEVVGLTGIDSIDVKPKRVKESPIHMECKLEQKVEIGGDHPGASTMVIGRVVRMHIHESAFQEGKIFLDEIKPISRLAGMSYGATPDTFDIQRPTEVKI